MSERRVEEVAAVDIFIAKISTDQTRMALERMKSGRQAELELAETKMLRFALGSDENGEIRNIRGTAH